MQALNVGETLTDTFTVTTVDGTAQLVTVTINGANDAAVITGATTGSVIEEGGVGSGIPGIPVASGHLDATEVDNPPDDWTTVATPTPGDNGYGTYTLTAAGVWTYTLDNSNAAVQALNTGRHADRHVHRHHGRRHAQVVTITIHGTDDAAVISGDFTGTVLEAGGVANGTPGIPTATGALNAADADSPPALDACRHADTGRQRLRQLHADGGRRLDLHAGRQQRDGAGAQSGRDPDRHLHGQRQWTAPHS